MNSAQNGTFLLLPILAVRGRKSLKSV